ncbi:MAG: hypothetical protein SGILL_007775, partial [Bacillariaceae sp.]
YFGDTIAKDLIGTLLDKCLAPYIDVLTNWLQSGSLRDPYDEFMVIQPLNQGRLGDLDGDSWSSLFQVSERNVVKDIIHSETTKQKVLVTGKYWNVIHACGEQVKPPQETLQKLASFRYQSDSSAIAAFVDNTYQYASQHLIDLLKRKYNLMDSLQTIKRYFLLDQGDFFMNFLEISEGELMKPIEDVSIGRVQHSLSMSIQLTEAQREGDVDLYSHFLLNEERQLQPNSLRCRFLGESLVSHLDYLYGSIEELEPRTPSRQAYGAPDGRNTGFDLFTIDFAHVPFPTSL